MSVVTTRLVSLDDVPELTVLALASREFLAPWSPVAPDRAFTAAGQAEMAADALARYDQGAMLPHVIVNGTDEIVGRINLNGITRGAFQSASVGYWVGEAHIGKGVATQALREIVRIAFTDLGLHRVQGETLLHNVASQRVLEHVGFARVGMAPRFLRIAGAWQDHLIYQLVNDAWAEPTPGST
jgi:ribosomal-protein-alanine N-acetyltransferase